MIDATRIPLVVGLSPANIHDSQLLEPMVDAIPAIIGPRVRPGRPRKRPARLQPIGARTTSCRRMLRGAGSVDRNLE